MNAYLGGILIFKKNTESLCEKAEVLTLVPSKTVLQCSVSTVSTDP